MDEEYKDDEESEASEKDEKLLEKSRKGLKSRVDYEQDCREKMLDDLKFCTLDQWHHNVRNERENDPNGSRPCLTIDQINQYITQVSNDLRTNSPSIKARPQDDKADIETAKIYQGLIRQIEDQSIASVAYESAGESAVKIGMGYFRVMTDYIDPDSFDQEIKICKVQDSFSVYLGQHVMPDGSDCDEAWVIEKMPLERFKREFPKAKFESVDFDGIEDMPMWKTEEDVTLTEYLYKKYEKKSLLFLKDGTSVFADKFDGDADDIEDKRDTHVVSVKWCKHTGIEILEERDWAGKFIPIIKVIGKEAYVEGKQVLWGLVRPAKDSLRAYNYWISAMVEKMGLSPKAPFIGAKGQFKGVEEQWKNANKENRAYLEYEAIDINGNAIPAPQRQQPTQMEAAMGQMLVMLQNNVKSSLGMYKAALGEAESQQSGKAILALQKESNSGTMHFGANLALAVRHCGRILIDLIPKIYDTKRIVRILGEDGAAKTANIDPEQPEAVKKVTDLQGNIREIYNLGIGRYDVTVSVGPGYTTARQEAATVMSELAQSAKDPASSAVLQYLTVKNSDFYGSDQALDMLKALLPPQVSQDEPIPPKAMQQIQQMQQQGQQLQQQMQEMAQENQQLKSGAQNDMAELQLKAQKQQEEIALSKEKVSAEIDLKKKIAQADYEIEQRKLEQTRQHKMQEMNFAHECRMKDEQAEAAQTMMPQTIEALNNMTQAFANIDAILQQQTVIQAKTLDAQGMILETLQRPKSVSIGAIQRDANGSPIGATVNSTIQ